MQKKNWNLEWERLPLNLQLFLYLLVLLLIWIFSRNQKISIEHVKNFNQFCDLINRDCLIACFPHIRFHNGRVGKKIVCYGFVDIFQMKTEKIVTRIYKFVAFHWEKKNPKKKYTTSVWVDLTNVCIESYIGRVMRH